MSRIYFLFLILSVFTLIGCGGSKAKIPDTVLDFDSDGVPDSLDLDDDNDTLTDAKEIEVGLDPKDADDAGQDIDGDGFTALEEVYLGSDYNDLNSFPVAEAWSTYQGSIKRNGFVLQQVFPENIEFLWNRTSEMSKPHLVANHSHLFISKTNKSEINWQNPEFSILSVDVNNGRIIWEYSLTKELQTSGSEWAIDLHGFANKHGLALSEQSLLIQMSGAASSPIKTYDATIYNIIDYHDAEVLLAPLEQFTETNGFAPLADKGLFYSSFNLFRTDGTPVQSPHTNSTMAPNVSSPTLDDTNIYSCFDKADVAGSSPYLVIQKRPAQLSEIPESEPSVYQIPDWPGCASDIASVKGNFNNLLAVNNRKMANLDLDTQTIIWSTMVDQMQPSVAFGKVYAIKEGNLIVLNELTGDLLWEHNTDTPFTSNIIITRNLIFVSTEFETLGIDRKTYELSWTVPVAGDLAISFGNLYITGNNMVSAYSLE
jgi:outer membrane protein assembly factor BamB